MCHCVCTGSSLSTCLLKIWHRVASIGANPRSFQTWDPIISKCERKLAKWKQRHLSFGGRVTLIKSMLTSIPIYFLSFFRVPKKVVDKLGRIQRRLLWGGDHEQSKIAWVKWETMCLPKEAEWLGVKDINSFNVSLYTYRFYISN